MPIALLEKFKKFIAELCVCCRINMPEQLSSIWEARRASQFPCEVASEKQITTSAIMASSRRAGP